MKCNDMQKCMNLESFVADYGFVYEHSAWVAERVFVQAMDDCLDNTSLSVEALTDRFEKVFMAASRDRQLATLRAHPLLACALDERVQLTTDSSAEQSAAGLDLCSATGFAEFGSLNVAYSEKFGFPFIIAVKGLVRQQILDSFRTRLQNDAVQEFETALVQVCRIAQFRIEGMLND